MNVAEILIYAFFEVTPCTMDNYIEKYGDELRRNGYEILHGKRMKSHKLAISAMGGNETDFVNIKFPYEKESYEDIAHL